MSRTTISIPANRRRGAAVLVLQSAAIATVIWQGARTAGTDGIEIGQRVDTVESAPVVPLRQLERAEHAVTANQVHRDAHGLVADEITRLSRGSDVTLTTERRPDNRDGESSDCWRGVCRPDAAPVT